MAYAALAVAVYFSGHLSGYRRVYEVSLFALLALVAGVLTYFIGKNVDWGIEGWAIASPLARVFLPVCYLVAALLPLALPAGAAFLASSAVFGRQRVWYFLTHLGSISITAETAALLLLPISLTVACYIFFVPYWHYSWTPVIPIIKLFREISDDSADDLAGGPTAWLDGRISELWERSYSSFGTETVNAAMLYLRTNFLILEHNFLGGNRIDEVTANARAAAEVCLRNPQRIKNYLWAEFTLSPLADALWLLYQARPDKSALDDAIWARRSLAESRSWLVMSPAEHKVNAAKLAALLASRFEITGNEEDLPEALTLARTAARAIREDDARAEALLTLGRIEQIRFERERVPSAFDAAAQAYRAAGSAGESEGESGYRLAMLLARRAELDGDDASRHESLRILRLWAEKANAYDPDGEEFMPPEQRARFMTGLADGLASSAGESAAAEAVTWYRRAAGIDDAPVALRLAAACGRGYHARDAADAADGFDQAVELLQQAVWPGLGRSAQVRLLARWPELTVDAAAAQLTAGRPARAVEILEQGRVVMWSQRVALRSAPLYRLREVDPDLFERLTAIRAELDAPVIRTEGGIGRFGQSNARAERHAALYREWDDAVRRHDLLGLPGYEDLRAAADAGPVVLLNASRQRCDALIVTRDLPLKQLGLPAEVYKKTRAWRQAAEEPGRTAAGWLQAGDEMLAWLWRDVTEPVLRWLAENNQLNADGGELPRLWWCPAGWLAHLPLHAAGLADSTRNSVMDRVVSSYTPSLSQLIRARWPGAHDRPRPGARMLVLAPDSNLPSARPEADMVCRFFPDHLLLPADAAKADYLREIGRHPLLHFVGHGYASEHEDISGDVRVGGLALPVTAGAASFISPRELSELPIDDARFAYLSICYAAAPDSGLLDEAVHPAAALHFGGFRNVIATLSPAADYQAKSVAEAVYAALASHGALNDDRSARALHDAVGRLRGERCGRWGLWTTYVHIGP